MGEFQMNEILLTAAQSLLAVALLVRMRLDLRGAFLLFGLFVGQFLAPVAMAPLSGTLPFKVSSENVHLFFSVLYILASVHFLLKNRGAVVELREGFKIEKVPESRRLAPVLAKSCSPNRRVNPEPALERAVSR
jgi:cation:H+ antiporter